MAPRTELELVILGVVAKLGPLTPYAVRRHFAESPTPSFSSSAGTIYPAMERLASDGLLSARAGARGRQARRTYRITAAGRRVHLAWLFEDLDGGVFAAQADPLRTRLYFRGLLPRRAQERFLKHAIERLRAERERLRSYAESYPDEGPTRYGRLASEGLVELTDARIRWLTRVRAELFGS